MKSFIKNITLPALLIAAMPLFTACSDDMEVGDTLHPTEAEDYSPKAYIYKTTDETTGKTSTVEETPNELRVPEDGMKFYVMLSKPLANDVVVTVKANPEAASATGKTVLGEGAFNIKTSSVTIKAGELKSAEPVDIELQKGDDLKNMAVGEAVMAFSISDVQGGTASSNYNTIVWTVKKMFNNVKPTGSVEGKTAYDGSDYNVWAYAWGGYQSGLNDGEFDNGYYDYTNDWDNPAWRIEFNEPKEVSAIATYAYDYGYGYGYGYCLAQYRVRSSDDGENWTDNGLAVSSTTPTSNSDATVCEFYKPVKAKYFQIIPVNDFYSRRAWSVFISEIKAFK